MLKAKTLQLLLYKGMKVTSSMVVSGVVHDKFRLAVSLFYRHPIGVTFFLEFEYFEPGRILRA